MNEVRMRNLCEVEMYQSMDMKLRSKLRERKKFESRAGKLIRIFDLGQKKVILLLTNIVWDMVKLNLQTSVGYDLVLILKRGVLSFGKMTSHFIEKSFPTFWFKLRIWLDIAQRQAISRDVISRDQISTGG